MAGGGKQRANMALGPTAIRVLTRRKVVENHIAILAPGQPFAGLRLGKHLGVAIVAKDVQGLGVIVVRVLPVAETVAAAFIDRNCPLAKLDPLLGQSGFVLAGTEQTRNGSRRQRRPLAAVESAAMCQAVDHPSVRGRAVLEVVV